jgi:hypothetical protein
MKSVEAALSRSGMPSGWPLGDLRLLHIGDRGRRPPPFLRAEKLPKPSRVPTPK